MSAPPVDHAWLPRPTAESPADPSLTWDNVVVYLPECKTIDCESCGTDHADQKSWVLMIALLAHLKCVGYPPPWAVYPTGCGRAMMAEWSFGYFHDETHRPPNGRWVRVSAQVCERFRGAETLVSDGVDPSRFEVFEF